MGRNKQREQQAMVIPPNRVPKGMYVGCPRSRPGIWECAGVTAAAHYYLGECTGGDPAAAPVCKKSGFVGRGVSRFVF